MKNTRIDTLGIIIFYRNGEPIKLSKICSKNLYIRNPKFIKLIVVILIKRLTKFIPRKIICVITHCYKGKSVRSTENVIRKSNRK